MVYMALLRSMVVALVFAFAASGLGLSDCEAVKAKVSCLDCSTNYDFSGIKLLVKCDQVKKMATSYTNSQGNFEVEIPKSSSAPSTNCLAKLLGGPAQLYASRDKMVSKIVQNLNSSSSHTIQNLNSSSYYTISTSLAFSTKCPIEGGKYCNGGNNAGSSKTVDFPLPREWGLAPSSYYFPFFPIIGIP